MYSRLRLFELKNTKFKTKHHLFIELSKILEVANFRFLANFRFFANTFVSEENPFYFLDLREIL